MASITLVSIRQLSPTPATIPTWPTTTILLETSTACRLLLIWTSTTWVATLDFITSGTLRPTIAPLPDTVPPCFAIPCSNSISNSNRWTCTTLKCCPQGAITTVPSTNSRQPLLLLRLPSCPATDSRVISITVRWHGRPAVTVVATPAAPLQHRPTTAQQPWWNAAIRSISLHRHRLVIPATTLSVWKLLIRNLLVSPCCKSNNNNHNRLY